MDNGILHGTGFTDGGAARLQRFYSGSSGNLVSAPSGFDPSTTIETGNSQVTVDDAGLWNFLARPSHSDTPDSCEYSNFSAIQSQYPGTISQAQLKSMMQTQMQNCFNDYYTGVGCAGGSAVPPQPCTGVLFDYVSNTVNRPNTTTYDIQLSTRFAYVPVLQAGPQNCPNNNGWCNIVVDFGPTYLQELFGGCNNGGGGCKLDFSPGVHDNAGQQGPGDAVTAFVMLKSMLPASIQAPYTLSQTISIQLIR
jgi:hypothetical protein